MLKQAIDLPGIGNARELGGYAAGDRIIKKGVLFRTAGLDGASKEALDKMQNSLLLQTVIDFRMTVERRVSPDPEIPSVRNIHLPVIEAEDYPVGVDTNMVEEIKKTDRMKLFEMAYASGMLNSDYYSGIMLGERGRNAYRGFFRVLLGTDPDKGAVLWHCTDGKDRTGCAAMLLLSALGASREVIIEDYMLTNEYNASRIGAVKQMAEAAQMPPDKSDALMFMSGAVVERYMTKAIDTLEEKYGSVEGYLREELNVGDPELEELRNKFLCGGRYE
ncbi:MAG TPA: hypothetical protein DDX72_03380 [Ruminococcaceae bacterium]|nr:hypothetical protein [Oscillospiraceae bacterium]